MNSKKNTAFEEARLCIIRFDASDILTASKPYVDEDGNIELPPVPIPRD